MRKLNIIVIAGMLGLAAILGTFAATRTTSLGAAARHANAASYQAQVRRLDAYAAELKRSLARKPPALPAVPAMPKVKAPVAPVAPVAPAAAAAAPVRVIYHRPPPVVVVKHTHHGDDGAEQGDGGGGGDD